MIIQQIRIDHLGGAEFTTGDLLPGLNVICLPEPREAKILAGWVSYVCWGGPADLLEPDVTGELWVREPPDRHLAYRRRSTTTASKLQIQDLSNGAVATDTSPPIDDVLGKAVVSADTSVSARLALLAQLPLRSRLVEEPAPSQPRPKLTRDPQQLLGQLPRANLAAQQDQLRVLLQQRRTLAARIQQAEQQARRATELTAQAEQLQHELAALEKQHRQLHQQVAPVQAAVEILPTWTRHRQLQHQLAQARHVQDVSAQDLTKLESVERQIRQLQKKLRQHVRDEDAESGSLTSRPNDAAGLASLKAAWDQRSWVETVQQKIAELDRQIDTLIASADDSAAACHPEHPRRVLRRLRQPARTLRTLRDQQRQLTAQWNELDDSSGPAPQIVPLVADASAQARASDLSWAEPVHAMVDVHRSKLEGELDELRQECDAIVTRRTIPRHVVLSIRGFFLSSIPLLLAALLLPSGIFNAPLFAMGVMAIISGMVLKSNLDRSAAQQLHICRQRMTRVLGELERMHPEPAERPEPAVHEPAQVLPSVPSAPAPPPVANPSSAVCRQQLAQQLHEIKDQYAQARIQWRHALLQAGLPAGWSPKKVLQAARTRQWPARSDRNPTIRDETAQQQLDDWRAERKLHQTWLDGWCQRVAAELPGHQTETDEQTVAAILQRLQQYWAEQQVQQTQQRQMHQEQQQRIRERQDEWQQQLKQRKRQRRRILAEVGVENRQALAALLDEQQRLLPLQQEFEELERQLTDSLADRADADAVRQLLLSQDAATLVQQKQQQQAELDRCKNQLGVVQRQLHVVRRDIAQLPEHRVREDVLQLVQVDQRLRRAAQRLLVLQLAETALAELADRPVSSESKPAAASVAGSSYLQQLWSDETVQLRWLSEQNAYGVQQASEPVRELTSLSDAQQEEVVLALRLAAAESLGRQGMHVPLVLDDRLLSACRAPLTAARLLQQQAATGQQIFIFTAESELADLFTRLQVPVLKISRRQRLPSPLTDTSAGHAAEENRAEVAAAVASPTADAPEVGSQSDLQPELTPVDYDVPAPMPAEQERGAESPYRRDGSPTSSSPPRPEARWAQTIARLQGTAANSLGERGFATGNGRVRTPVLPSKARRSAARPHANGAASAEPTARPVPQLAPWRPPLLWAANSSQQEAQPDRAPQGESRKRPAAAGSWIMISEIPDWWPD